MTEDRTDKDYYTFTIFTPTYNRAATLERLFDSIAQQSFRDFEWIIVDDGSTDNTAALIDELSADADFPIRYLWQENSGKYAAFDHGVREAKGTLFFTIDSDDELTHDALEILHDAWLAIPAHDRARFTGVTARCIDEEGKLVGERAMRSPLDSDSAEATLVLGLHGERVGFHRTTVLRAHPFPRSVPTRFIPEGRIWLDIARHYKTRFIEAPARIFHDHDAPRLSALDRSERAWGDLEYYRFTLVHYASWWRRAPIAIAKTAVGLRRAELHLGLKADRGDFSSLALLWAAAASPMAILAYARDLVRQNGSLGIRLLLGRLLLRSRGGPRLAALLGTRLHKRRGTTPIAIHAKGVVPVLSPCDRQNYELLFSPKTFKADLLPVLERLITGCRKAAVVGENVTFVALQLARFAPSARILAVESEAEQSGRTRSAARASYADRIETITANGNAAGHLLADLDLIIFDDARNALTWMGSPLWENAPGIVVIENTAGTPSTMELLTNIGYRSNLSSTGRISVWVHEAQGPALPNSA